MNTISTSSPALGHLLRRDYQQFNQRPYLEVHGASLHRLVGTTILLENIFLLNVHLYEHEKVAASPSLGSAKYLTFSYND